MSLSNIPEMRQIDEFIERMYETGDVPLPDLTEPMPRLQAMYGDRDPDNAAKQLELERDGLYD